MASAISSAPGTAPNEFGKAVVTHRCPPVSCTPRLRRAGDHFNPLRLCSVSQSAHAQTLVRRRGGCARCRGALRADAFTDRRQSKVQLEGWTAPPCVVVCVRCESVGAHGRRTALGLEGASAHTGFVVSIRSERIRDEGAAPLACR